MVNSLNDALQIAGMTDPGMVREHNEDSIFFDAAQGLVILADGMGGYNAGEVASGMATSLLSTALTAAFAATPPYASGAESATPVAGRILKEKIEEANLAVLHAAQTQPQCAGMGTTLVAAVFYDNRLTVAHIGDSRLYRLRGDEFGTITRDHSLLQEQIDSGMITPEEARFSQNRNLVTRALGVEANVNTEVNDFPVEIGDIYLLCSDGLNDMVDDEEIKLTLQTLSANLELAATQLVQMANDNGGRDNVSVILVKILQDFAVPAGWWAKVRTWFS